MNSSILNQLCARRWIPDDSGADHIQTMKQGLIRASFNHKEKMKVERQPNSKDLPAFIRDFATITLILPRRSGNTVLSHLMYDEERDAYLNPKPDFDADFPSYALDRYGYQFSATSIVWVDLDNMSVHNKAVPELVAFHVQQRGGKEIPLVVCVGGGWLLG